ncbi:GyrI-like domain-containing protein [Bosea sp. PAMC 26642]|uniref:GyrI-like domain-containing protein n=1 Tax=Bosea sp. (strain PAMC 26642) TaxID=1792307 RepID=UPI0012E8D372|nr:GyrI-like domain-containing protein [Bosea sp. PAMC 26642]
MRHFWIGVLAVVVMAGSASLASAQTRVAPPSPVESAPLAPPPGAVPVQAQPALPAEPQPVQPPPAPQLPVTPQPVQPAPAPTVPLEPQPVQPPPTLPPPGQLLPAPPVTPQQRTGIPDPNSTLAGRAGDPSDVDPVVLVGKPVLMISGQSSWDQGFQRLTESFRVLREEAARSGLAIAGRPLSLFVETDDNGFRFEAMLPVDRTPDRTPTTNGIRAGVSPAGPSLRFVHVAPYDDIDSTYETITAYLEAKSIVVKDAFLEEYVSELTDPGDPNLEINVYVQPK